MFIYEILRRASSCCFLLIEVRKSDLGMTAIRSYFGSYLILRVHILCIHILWIILYAKSFLALTRGDSSGSLNFSFLSSACSSASHPLFIRSIPTSLCLRILSSLIEIISSSWKCWQSIWIRNSWGFKRLGDAWQ